MSKSNYKDHLFALIVAGGGGTRLWPRSRNATPKQFLKLFNNKTLTQITARRFNKIIPWEKIFVVTTTEDYKREVLREIPKFRPENIIVEPRRRNTAPAHGLGAVFIRNSDPDAVILNESADHLVSPLANYFATLKAAAAAAYSNDWLITIGIKPTYPNVGYGYIKRGKKIGTFEGKTVFKLDRFTEKPDLKLAEKYLASGKYTWNANEFVWRADSYIKALSKFEPSVGKSLASISKAIGTSKVQLVINNEYERMPEKTKEGKPLSIDFAVAEKAKNFLTVEADYNWTDIGDWKEVWENRSKDKDGNLFIDGEVPGGEIINLDTHDTIVHTDGRLIALVGLEDIVVIDTKDALLVASKSKAQNVKKIVNRLKKEKKTKYL